MDLSHDAPPSLPLGSAAQALAKSYGIEGVRLFPILAERDQNLRVESPAGHYLLKICNLAEGRDLILAQAAALQHIARAAPHLPVPRVISTPQGESVGTLQYGGVTYCLLMLTWLPGKPFGASPMGAETLSSLGRLLAQLGLALKGFEAPAISTRQLLWNITAVDALRGHVSLLPEHWQARAHSVLNQFTQVVKPRLASLPAHIIHADVHPFNTLKDEAGNIVGIIDFGDMLHAPLVCDVSNAAADCLADGRDPVSAIAALLQGYVSVTPISTEELACVVPLVQARLLSTALIAKARAAQGIANTAEVEQLAASSLGMLGGVLKHEAALQAACAKFGQQAHGRSILQRRMQAMGPKPLLFYSKPLHFVSGQGVWLTAVDGRRYLDCYNNVAHVGHAHPHVADAVSRQLHVLNTNTRYLTDEAIAYAEALKATLHPSLDTVVFVNSGSEANDVAWRMANVWTGKRGALCMEFAYHGVTMAADALSPSNYPPGKWHVPHVRQLPAPDVYRGPWRTSDASAGASYAALADTEIAILQREGHGLSIAILDSAFMTNGILDAPAGYVQGLVQRVHAAGGLFIADEVQSGFGRMGTAMWGHQHHGVIPDFVTIGKPAGNGYPIGAIITRAEILNLFTEATGPFFSTFGGGNAACASGRAVLEVMRSAGLQWSALETGSTLRNSLQKLSEIHEIIGDVRGVGLATGVELVRSRKTREPAREETRRILDLMRDEGVLIGSDGPHGNVLKLRPPMVFNSEHAGIVANALHKALLAI